MFAPTYIRFNGKWLIILRDVVFIMAMCLSLSCIPTVAMEYLTNDAASAAAVGLFSIATSLFFCVGGQVFHGIIEKELGRDLVRKGFLFTWLPCTDISSRRDLHSCIELHFSCNQLKEVGRLEWSSVKPLRLFERYLHHWSFYIASSPDA